MRLSLWRTPYRVEVQQHSPDGINVLLRAEIGRHLLEPSIRQVAHQATALAPTLPMTPTPDMELTAVLVADARHDQIRLQIAGQVVAEQVSFSTERAA